MIARYCLVATFVCVWVLPLSCETHSKDAKNSSATKTTSKYDFRTQQCSREKSKFVREYFARQLLPIYQKYSVPVPDKCPFSPIYDMYHYQENNKTKMDRIRWRCEYCGKQFLSEKFLDKHFDSRHTNSLNVASNTVCLADHCKVFRCDVLMESSDNSVSQSKPTKCNDNVMTNLRNKCQTQLDLCVPKSATHSTRSSLIIELRENLCAYLTCSRHKEMPGYMSIGPNFLIIFLVVVGAGLCLVTYGVLNHTDLIVIVPKQRYDENETADTTGGRTRLENDRLVNEAKNDKPPNNQHQAGLINAASAKHNLNANNNNDLRQRLRPKN